MNSLYKEFFEANSKEEQEGQCKALTEKGFHPSEIYKFNYQGNDGKFHRTTFVWNRER